MYTVSANVDERISCPEMDLSNGHGIVLWDRPMGRSWSIKIDNDLISGDWDLKWAEHFKFSPRSRSSSRFVPIWVVWCVGWWVMGDGFRPPSLPTPIPKSACVVTIATSSVEGDPIRSLALLGSARWEILAWSRAGHPRRETSGSWGPGGIRRITMKIFVSFHLTDDLFDRFDQHSWTCVRPYRSLALPQHLGCIWGPVSKRWSKVRSPWSVGRERARDRVRDQVRESDRSVERPSERWIEWEWLG
jgi:hypothetical protein